MGQFPRREGTPKGSRRRGGRERSNTSCWGGREAACEQQPADQLVEGVHRNGASVNPPLTCGCKQLGDRRGRLLPRWQAPEQSGRKRLWAVLQGIAQCGHQRLISAAVAGNQQPVTLRRLQQRDAVPVVLVAKFVTGVLQPIRLEIPVQLHVKGKAIGGHGVHGDLGGVQSGNGEVGGWLEHELGGTFNNPVEVRGPDDLRSSESNPGRQAEISEDWLAQSNLVLDVAPPAGRLG